MRCRMWHRARCVTMRTRCSHLNRGVDTRPNPGLWPFSGIKMAAKMAAKMADKMAAKMAAKMVGKMADKMAEKMADKMAAKMAAGRARDVIRRRATTLYCYNH